MSGVVRALRVVFSQRSRAAQVAPGNPGRAADAGPLPDRCAAALAAHAADLSAPVAEFGCGSGAGGAALARAGFACIDGFDPSDANLAQAERRGVYRRLARADLADPAALEGVGRCAYANAAAIEALDPARVSPRVLDAVLALLPSGGCLVFALPGRGASVGRFRTRVLELCEHFVAEPVFRATGPRSQAPEPRASGKQVPGLQSTLYVLKKR